MISYYNLYITPFGVIRKFCQKSQVQRQKSISGCAILSIDSRFSPPRSPPEGATIRFLCLNFNAFFCEMIHCTYRFASFKISKTGKKSMMGCRCILQELQEQGLVVSKHFFTVILYITYSKCSEDIFLCSCRLQLDRVE